MRSSIRSTVRAVRTAALLFGAAAPGTAQAARIATGIGQFVGQNQQNRLFAFSVVERADGSVRGQLLAFEPGTRGLVIQEVTSYWLLGNTVVMAGPITVAINAPPEYAVGATGFCAATSSPDGMTGSSIVPAFLGSLTAEQIIALIGPPPTAVFAPLLAGHIRIY
jgi:hypothetical protein